MTASDTPVRARPSVLVQITLVVSRPIMQDESPGDAAKRMI